MSEPQTPKPRGFAAMTPEKRREIAKSGGQAVHRQGKGHEFDSVTGKAAGLKSGQTKRGGQRGR